MPMNIQDGYIHILKDMCCNNVSSLQINLSIQQCQKIQTISLTYRLVFVIEIENLLPEFIWNGKWQEEPRHSGTRKTKVYGKVS